MTPEMKLERLGITLPPAEAPLAAYAPLRVAGDLLYLSGQGPIRDGKPLYRGKLGRELTLEQGVEAAKLTAVNSLAAIRREIGSLARIAAIPSLTAYVASVPEFHSQHLVANGASEFLVEVLGEAGRHARVAIGTNVLPMDLPLEIAMIVQISR